MELLFIRHGLPRTVEATVSAADPGLSPQGRDQAHRLGTWLGTGGVAAIYSSPLRRARETAEIVAALLGLPVTADEGLTEFDAHAPFYVPVEELRRAGDPRWQSLVAGDWSPFGGDTPAAMQTRVVETVERIVGRHPGQSVALVCHGGVLNLYASWLLGVEPQLLFDTEYSSISRVLAASRSGVRSLRSLNERSHLHAAVCSECLRRHDDLALEAPGGQASP